MRIGAESTGPDGLERLSRMPDVIGWLTDPYAVDFMRRALLASLFVGAIAPLVGVWIVLRRLPISATR